MTARERPDDVGQRTLPGAAPLIGPVDAPALHLMSWNIRRGTGSLSARKADRWNLRAPRLRALLHHERPSVLGVQEALDAQTRYISESLGPAFRSVGHGRGPRGGGEGCPIFYDAERFELLDWEQSALSDTPRRAGSRSWGNLIPRVLVMARFRDREASTAFLVLNTHLDHLSGSSRLRAAHSIRALVTDSPLPVAFTADMNAGPTSASVGELLRGGALADTWGAAEHRVSQEWGTFANYREPRRGRRRIDWIMASPEVRVLRTAINGQRHHGGWASDHLPVQAVLALPQKGIPA